MRWRPATTMMAIVLISPLVLLGLLSVSRQWTWPNLLPATWQWSQWRALLQGQQALAPVLLRSLLISSTVALVATALAFPTSKAIARHRRRSRLLVLAHLPFAVSPVVLGVALLYAFIRFGLAGHVSGVVLAQILLAYAYGTLLLQGFWSDRVDALADLANTMGATPGQRWWHVFVPMARPMLTVCLFQTFLVSWFDFALVLLIGGGQVTTLTLQLYAYMGSGDVRLAATCALLLSLPPLALLAMRHRLPGTAVAVNLESADEP